MGEVNATIYLKEREPEKGWGYTRWVLDVGKGLAKRASARWVRILRPLNRESTLSS